MNIANYDGIKSANCALSFKSVSLFVRKDEEVWQAWTQTTKK